MGVGVDTWMYEWVDESGNVWLMRKVSLILHQIPFLVARRLEMDVKFEPKTFTFFSCFLVMKCCTVLSLGGIGGNSPTQLSKMIVRKPPSKMVSWRNRSSQGRTLCKLFYSFDLAWRVVCVWRLGVWKQVQKKKLFKEVDILWRPLFQWIIFPCSIDFYDSMTSILIVGPFFLPLLFLSICLLLNFHKPILTLEYPIEALSSLWLVKGDLYGC